MKRVFLAAIIFAAAVFNSYSDTVPAIDADKIFKYVHEKTVVPRLDTIGGTDSIKVLPKKWKPIFSDEPGAYVLRIPAISGTGSDSVKYVVITRCYSPEDALMNEFKTDTVTAATGKDLLLPIGIKAGGSYYETVMKGITGNGSQHIIPGLWVYKAVLIESLNKK